MSLYCIKLPKTSEETSSITSKMVSSLIQEHVRKSPSLDIFQNRVVLIKKSKLSELETELNRLQEVERVQKVRSEMTGKKKYFKALFYEIQEGIDLITGEPLKDNFILHHIIPVNEGGDNNIENLIAMNKETHRLYIHTGSTYEYEKLFIESKLYKEHGERLSILYYLWKQEKHTCWGLDKIKNEKIEDNKYYKAFKHNLERKKKEIENGFTRVCNVKGNVSVRRVLRTNSKRSILENLLYANATGQIEVAGFVGKGNKEIVGIVNTLLGNTEKPFTASNYNHMKSNKYRIVSEEEILSFSKYVKEINEKFEHKVIDQRPLVVRLLKAYIRGDIEIPKFEKQPAKVIVGMCNELLSEGEDPITEHMYYNWKRATSKYLLEKEAIEELEELLMKLNNI